MNIQIIVNNRKVLAKVSKDNVKIYDSYQFSKQEIKECVLCIKEACARYGFNYTRSSGSWEAEWSAHNLLYKLNFKAAQTKDVDLNEGEPFWRRACYRILSLFYR